VQLKIIKYKFYIYESIEKSEVQEELILVNEKKTFCYKIVGLTCGFTHLT